MDGKSFSVDKMAPAEIEMFFRKTLRQTVSIHSAMFHKLLFQNEELPLELAALFEDVGNRYLDFSDEIGERQLMRRQLQVE
jgi:hypothetical protein